MRACISVLNQKHIFVYLHATGFKPTATYLTTVTLTVQNHFVYLSRQLRALGNLKCAKFVSDDTLRIGWHHLGYSI